MNELTNTKNTALALAGQAANAVAEQHIFADYRARRAANTLRAQAADLLLFAEFLESIGAPTAGDLATDPQAWRGITWGLTAAFVQWLLGSGYAITSINRTLSTIKKYAGLAFRAGALDAAEYAQLKLVSGYPHKEAVKVDEKRIAAGGETRRPVAGAKKAVHVSLDAEQIAALKQQPDTPQGRRDAVLMCLLLNHGLRCGEAAGLTVGALKLKAGELKFYRPKVHKVQTHRLTAETRAALKRYHDAGDLPLAAAAPLLRASKKNGALTAGRMSERAITKRVQQLGAALGIVGLSAHDCRHAWATRASRKGTDPFALQEAGGWNSLAMPRRYVEAAKIANEGVKL